MTTREPEDPDDADRADGPTEPDRAVTPDEATSSDAAPPDHPSPAGDAPAPDRRGPADFDRVFAEMTAGWSSSGDDPAGSSPDAASPSSSTRAPGHPLLRNREDVGEPEDTEELFRYQEPPDPDPEPEVDDGWFERPEVTPIPWSSLSLPAVLGGLLMAFTVGVLLLSLLGARFPTVVGYLAVGSFVIGFGLLMTRLRRSDDPDPGHGAQL